LEVDLEEAIGSSGESDAGIPQGNHLLRFVAAAQSESQDLPAARGALEEVVGPAGVTEASATIAVFNGLVRVADGTGIQLDAGLDAASASTRARLGLDQYGGAANTPRSVGTPGGSNSDEIPTGVTGLFG